MKEKESKDPNLDSAKKIASRLLERDALDFVEDFNIADRLALSEDDTLYAVIAVAKQLLISSITEDIEKLGYLPGEESVTLRGFARISPGMRAEHKIWLKEFAVQVIDSARDDYVSVQQLTDDECIRVRNIGGAVENLFDLMQEQEPGQLRIQDHQVAFWERSWRTQCALPAETVGLQVNP